MSYMQRNFGTRCKLNPCSSNNSNMTLYLNCDPVKNNISLNLVDLINIYPGLDSIIKFMNEYYLPNAAKMVAIFPRYSSNQTFIVIDPTANSKLLHCIIA